MTPEQREQFIGELEERMREAARKFEFEKAAQIRDKLKALAGEFGGRDRGGGHVVVSVHDAPLSARP